MHRRGHGATVLLSALLIACGAAVSACGDDDGTTTVEPSTTTTTTSSTRSTIVASAASIDAIVRTWVQLGFSEDQARCLAEQMNQMSTPGSSSTTDASTNQNLIEQMMKVCNIEDESLKAQLGG